MEEKQETNVWIEWGKTIGIAVVLAFFIKTFLFSTSIVEGESMAPTLKSGDRIIFNKAVYLIGKPKRGDIVIIKRPLKNYVKRIIGLPGETIEIRNNILYINDIPYEQKFISEDLINRTGNIEPIQIPQGAYYVMGDNRPISKDSRNGLGFIEEKHIIGRSEIIFYPFHEWSFTR